MKREIIKLSYFEIAPILNEYVIENREYSEYYDDQKTLAQEIQPYKINENGEKEIFFPVEELGLPDAYKKPWGNKRHKVWVYKYEGEVIWGITSVIIKDLLEKY